MSCKCILSTHRIRLSGSPWCAFFYFIHIFYHFKNVSVFFGKILHINDNNAVFFVFHRQSILFHTWRQSGITLPDRASDPAWSVTSHMLLCGVIGWRQLLPSTNCMIMRLFSRHCRMMWPVWRHKVASCFILLSFPSGVTYDPRSAVRESHLRTECHRLRIIVRSHLLAIAGLTNKPIYPFISLIRHVPCWCCIFSNDLLHATQQHWYTPISLFCPGIIFW